MRDAPTARPARPKMSWAWLGVVPFFLFTFLFLLYPSSTIVVRSFRDQGSGGFTLDNIISLFKSPYILGSYWISIKISLITALGGAAFGFLLAYAAIRGGLPRFVRISLLTFCGVASNFAGVPLAFAFIALLSPAGLLISWMKLFGYNPYFHGFTLYTFWGLSLVYMYFQFPLMVLIIAPAIDGLRREWLEASEKSWSQYLAILEVCGLPNLIALPDGYHDPPFWECFWCFCHRPGAHWWSDQPGDNRDRLRAAWRCFG